VTFEVIDPGPLTTVQDLGRPGYGAFGIPAGGAMDRAAARTANRLAGSGPNAATLEFTLRGPRLRWRGARPVEVAVVGDATVQEVLARGDVLDCGALRERARGYLAVRNGFDVPAVLGSRSTCLAGAFGGHRGRALSAGDRLRVNRPRTVPVRGGRRFDDRQPPATQVADFRDAMRDLRDGGSAREVRLLALGRAEGAALEQLLAGTWRVAESDRVGMRLKGPPVEVAPLQASRPMCAGVVQITGEGQPIILLRDHPTLGGYPLAGVVIGADLDHCAQLRPGATVRFRRVTERFALGATAAS
jgi:biotin-dependent carboxylase-like uncharacterized protein